MTVEELEKRIALLEFRLAQIQPTMTCPYPHYPTVYPYYWHYPQIVWTGGVSTTGGQSSGTLTF